MKCLPFAAFSTCNVCCSFIFLFPFDFYNAFHCSFPRQFSRTSFFIPPSSPFLSLLPRIASLQDCNFTRAREFLPERWLDRAAFPVHSADLVLPFGAGKRACPGRKLAQQEVHIIVAKTFQRYRVDLIDPFRAEFNWLLTPAGSMRVRLEERV